MRMPEVSQQAGQELPLAPPETGPRGRENLVDFPVITVKQVAIITYSP